MKYFTFIIWMLFTVILALSIIGLFVIWPKINCTEYDMTQEECRSTWMRIGYDMYKSL